jgi:Type VI secretion system/phage-baseplate injector OB domain
MTSALRRRQQRRYPGLYRGLVLDATDPQLQHRVQVTVPSVSGSLATWAATLRGPGSPQVGDEVLVGFDAGRLDRPYVVGILASSTPGTVELSDENGNTIRLSPSGVEISAAGEVRISASKISFSSGMGSADAGIWKFSGVVQSQTLITDSVVAASYTPGTGNVM